MYVQLLLYLMTDPVGVLTIFTILIAPATTSCGAPLPGSTDQVQSNNPLPSTV
jgi:hypothetical protein